MDLKRIPLPTDCFFEPSEHALHPREASIGAPPPRRDELAEKCDILQALVPLSLDLKPHVFQPPVDQLVEGVELGDVSADGLDLDAKRFIEDAAHVSGKPCFEVRGHLVHSRDELVCLRTRPAVGRDDFGVQPAGGRHGPTVSIARATFDATSELTGSPLTTRKTFSAETLASPAISRMVAITRS